MWSIRRTNFTLSTILAFWYFSLSPAGFVCHTFSYDVLLSPNLFPVMSSVSVTLSSCYSVRGVIFPCYLPEFHLFISSLGSTSPLGFSLVKISLWSSTSGYLAISLAVFPKFYVLSPRAFTPSFSFSLMLYITRSLPMVLLLTMFLKSHLLPSTWGLPIAQSSLIF